MSRKRVRQENAHIDITESVSIVCYCFFPYLPTVLGNSFIIYTRTKNKRLVTFKDGFKVLISILPKNQAAPIEMVISDFFRILKPVIAFVSLCHKSPKAKGKL